MNGHRGGTPPSGETPASRRPQSATFSTNGIAPADRFDAWRGLIGLTHEIETDHPAFEAQLTSTALDGVMVSEMFSSAQTVSRSLQRIRRDGLDHITLHVTTAPFHFECNDTRHAVPVGAVTVNTLSRPFHRTAAPEHGSLILSLSRNLLAEALPEPELFHGQVLQGAFGSLLAEHIRMLVRHGASIEASEAAGIARASAQLLAAALQPRKDRIAEARAGLNAALLTRCKRYIELNLSRPTLAAESICREVGLSRSSLYRLFAEYGGISHYIQIRRLEAVRSALSAEGPSTRISEIAYRYGFTNYSAFSRAFRKAYGVSPSDTASSGSGTTTLSPDIFSQWMRVLTFGRDS